MADAERLGELGAGDQEVLLSSDLVAELRRRAGVPREMGYVDLRAFVVEALDHGVVLDYDLGGFYGNWRYSGRQRLFVPWGYVAAVELGPAPKE